MNKSNRYLYVIIAALCCLSPLGAAEPGAAISGDVPWKLHETTRALFPTRLKEVGIVRGEARVRISLSASGQLTDALVIACSHRDFGDEALRVVKEWRYDPELVDGQPIGVVGEIRVMFTVNGTVAVDRRNPMRDDSYGAENPLAYKAEGMKNLDRIPMPSHVVAPLYLDEWAQRGMTGNVTVQFYIDENGHARLPVAVSSNNVMLSSAAVAAVAQWQFEPPTRHGQPVLTRAEQTFAFQPPKK